MERIEKCIDADACRNVDRMMRLPGTINVLSIPRSPLAGHPLSPRWSSFTTTESTTSRTSRRSSRRHALRSRARRPHDAGRDEIERIRDALRAIPADDYDTYLRVCMAIKSALGDSGFNMARDWAMTSVKFEEAEFRRTWASIKPEGGVTIATLF